VEDRPELQMTNIKCQMFRPKGTRIFVLLTGKFEYPMSNLKFRHLDFSTRSVSGLVGFDPRPSQMSGIDWAFGF